jgi:hypothetical protein
LADKQQRWADAGDEECADTECDESEFAERNTIAKTWCDGREPLDHFGWKLSRVAVVIDAAEFRGEAFEHPRILLR